MKQVISVRSRNKWIIGLVIAGLTLFAVIQFIVIPKQALQERIDEEQQRIYAKQQQYPATHDLNRILEYKHPYMGKATNLIQIFNHLPLSEYGTTFEIDSDKLAVAVNYDETVLNIGEDHVKQALKYNSIAAFALIDNLQEIIYNFPDQSYPFTRAEIEANYGSPLSRLLTIDKWKTEVQDKL